MSEHATLLGMPSSVIQTGNPELDGFGVFYAIGGAAGRGLRIFRSAELNAFVYVDAAVTPMIEIDEMDFSQLAKTYNGKPAWGSASRLMVFYSAVYGEWIYFPNGGEEPFATQKLDGTWDGDRWWGLGADAPGPGWNPVPAPRGEFIDDGAAVLPSIAWKWPRWQWNAVRSRNSVAPCGCYVPEDQPAAETRVFSVGIRCWRITSPIEASLVASFDGTHFEFGEGGNHVRLTKAVSGDSWSSDWDHGEGVEAVWYEMTGEPKTGFGAVVTKHWYVESGGIVVERTYSFELPFYGCVPSGRRRVCRIGEVGQWR